MNKYFNAIKIVTITSATIFMGGCFSNVKYSEHDVSDGRIVTLSYPADKRAATIMYRSSGSEEAKKIVEKKFKEISELDENDAEYDNKLDRLLEQIKTISAASSVPYIISEPPPQTSKDININFKGKLGETDIGNLDFVNDSKKLFEVTSQNLVIRDALYRLNEAYFTNTRIKEADYVSLFKEILKTAQNIKNPTVAPEKETDKNK